MKKVAIYLIVTLLIVKLAMWLGEYVPASIWAVGWFSYSALLVLVAADQNNMLGRRITPHLPKVLFALYMISVAFFSYAFSELYPLWKSICFAVIGVTISDYLGQLTVGEGAVMGLGKDHILRPWHKSRKSDYYY